MYSLIIPVYNEEESISEIIDSSRKCMMDCLHGGPFEIIVVDDGSGDQSLTIARTKTYKELVVLQHSTRRGVGAARTTGVLHAKGKKILFIDADCTYNASDIPKVIEGLTHSDMVIGARKEEKGTFFILRASIKYLFRKLAGALTKTNIPDLNSGLRGMDCDKTRQFLYVLPTGHSWVSTITLCFLASGFSVSFIPITYNKRKGKSKFKIVRDTYSFFVTILKTVVYFYPLRVIMPVSIFFFMSGLVFFTRDIIQRNMADTTILLFVVSVIMFIFALISEQLACLRREINQKINQ
ncbi:MAG: glycosyltransferase family 2 protein [Candidatus Omnitrophica bacterium]|nr:glycosyltransferase family 2 protein [Candidatus Omnitrophota bacterium]